MRRTILGGDPAPLCSDYQLSLEEIAATLAAKIEALQEVVVPGLLVEGSTVEEAECKRQYEILIDIKNQVGLEGSGEVNDETKQAVTAPKKTQRSRIDASSGSQNGDGEQGRRRPRVGSNTGNGKSHVVLHWVQSR